jgi:hypothetical protein
VGLLSKGFEFRIAGAIPLKKIAERAWTAANSLFRSFLTAKL